MNIWEMFAIIHPTYEVNVINQATNSTVHISDIYHLINMATSFQT